MKKVTLTHVEATGIQDYIFGSNNLRQNIGASELVERATHHWVGDILDVLGKELGMRHNGKCIKALCRWQWRDLSISEPDVFAEVIYAGGGNALILFDGEPDANAKEFARLLTRQALKDARGLSLIVDHLELKWVNKGERGGDALSKKHRELREKIIDRKGARLPDVPLTGLGVTAAGDFSGLPASGLDELDNTLISIGIQHKLYAQKKLANDRLHCIIPDVRDNGYEFVHNFDQFGEKGESSYIAAVHTDGNGMASRFRAIADAHPDPADNAEYIKQLRHFSDQVNDQVTAALQATVGAVLEDLKKRVDGKIGGVVPVPKTNEGKFLPFRPIVFGGDDVTFVCEGRLGLTLAAKYLQTLSEGELPGPKASEKGEPLYARAGVAVVKSHYPFSRTYDLAETLCASAKKKLRDFIPDGHEPWKGTTIDWHFSTTGLVLQLEEVRAREYVSDRGSSLLMRPVWLDLADLKTDESKYWRSWTNFEKIVNEFKTKRVWAARRNKIKAVQDALRQDPSAVEQFLINYSPVGKQLLLPDIPKQESMQRTGWQADDCGYFDAIEALDFYVPLNGEEGKS